MSWKSEWIPKKRDRTQNWQPEEKRELFELIKKNIHTVENKKIDAETTAAKNYAWQNICSSFKKNFSTDRDPTRMREQWRRMKTQSQIDIRSFENKVKSVGLNEAKRSMPSSLSIEVWRLLQSMRQSGDILDDEADDVANLQAILETICPSNTLVDPLFENFKAEYVTLDNDPCADDEDIFNNSNQEQKSEEEEEEELEIPVERKRRKLLTSNGQKKNPIIEESLHQREQFLLEAAQEEHKLKMKILGIELEKAELQKQTAQNELKTSEVQKKMINSQTNDYASQVRMIGERGSGAGKGGGGGGSIREAGGSFGKMEAANEDQYFYNQQKEQLKDLREGLHDEISFHEEQIKRHQEAINRHKERIGNMEKK